MVDAATVAQWGYDTGNVLGVSDAFLASDPALVGTIVEKFAQATYDYTNNQLSGPRLRGNQPLVWGSPPNFRTLSLGHIEVVLADFWTDRCLSVTSRSTAKALVSKHSNTLTLTSG
jgi:hypothetical protein